MKKLIYDSLNYFQLLTILIDRKYIYKLDCKNLKNCIEKNRRLLFLKILSV